MAFKRTVVDDEVEVVVFQGYRYRRYKNAKKPEHRKYFNRSGKLLHRAVWEFYHGAIPRGYHVHHIDEDTGNNDISNLECLPAEQHRKLLHKHKQEYSTSAKQLEHLEKIREKTKHWHASPEGRAWHSANAKRQAEKAKAEGLPYFGKYARGECRIVCKWCERSCIVKSKRAVYCSNSCGAEASKFYRTGKGKRPNRRGESLQSYCR